MSREPCCCCFQVKALPGLGTTIDVILANGQLKEGDTIVVAGIEGPIVTQIRALLTPQPLKELRVKNQYINHKELTGAQGVKIAAKDLEKALAGIPMFVAQQPDEVDYLKVRRTEAPAKRSNIFIQHRVCHTKCSVAKQTSNKVSPQNICAFYH